MKEWLDHHIGHGVDHFYLVNDGSDDNYYEVLKPYIENRLITMCPAPKKNMKFRQVAAYNRVLQRIMVKCRIKFRYLNNLSSSPILS